MAAEHTLGDISPEHLGLQPDDPVMERFEAISNIFTNLKLPLFALPLARRNALTPSQEGAAVYESPDSPPDFISGVDYFFGQYKGNPRTIEQNAAAAIYHGIQRVPVWALLKSIAFKTPNNRLAIIHMRGDRQVDKIKLSQMFNIDSELPMADEDQLKEFGLEHGTVNPLIPDSDGVQHIYDHDLVSGADYPGSNILLTSSGDPRFFVGFDIKKYIEAKRQFYASRATYEISMSDEKFPKRIVARRPIIIISGDSSFDGMGFGQTIARRITELLIREHQYFGDQSVPPIQVRSDPRIAASIDTNLYSPALRSYISNEIIPELSQFSTANKDRRALVAYSSFAMEGTAGDILDQTEEIEYVGSKDVVENLLTELQERNVEIANTLLIGLPSVYNNQRSAFAGKILDEAPNVNTNVRQNIQRFVQEYKTGKVDKARSKLYQSIESILRSNAHATSFSFDGLKGQNIVVVLGASELESFMSGWDQIPDDDDKNREKYNNMFTIIRSDDPSIIKEEIKKAKVPDDKKIHLVFISPKLAVADTIAKKTLGLAV